MDDKTVHIPHTLPQPGDPYPYPSGFEAEIVRDETLAGSAWQPAAEDNPQRIERVCFWPINHVVEAVPLRDYHLAHAPADPPAWFQHTPAPNALEPFDYKRLTPNEQRELLKRQMARAADVEDGMPPLPADTSPAMHEAAEWLKKYEAWKKADDETRWWQWREYYAAETLRRRPPSIKYVPAQAKP